MIDLGVRRNRLVISNVTHNDSGEYRCTASSGSVSVNSEYGTVSVLGKLVDKLQIMVLLSFLLIL